MKDFRDLGELEFQKECLRRKCREITALLEDNDAFLREIEPGTNYLKVHVPRNIIQTVARVREEYHLDEICLNDQQASAIAYAIELNDLFSWIADIFYFYGPIKITLHKYMVINLVSVMETLMMEALQKSGIARKRVQLPELLLRKNGYISLQTKKNYMKLRQTRNHIHLFKAKESVLNQDVFKPELSSMCQKLLKTMADELSESLRKNGSETEKSVQNTLFTSSSAYTAARESLGCIRKPENSKSSAARDPELDNLYSSRIQNGFQNQKLSEQFIDPRFERGRQEWAVSRISDNNRKLSVLFTQTNDLRSQLKPDGYRYNSTFPKYVIRSVESIRKEFPIEQICPNRVLSGNIIFALEMDDLMRFILSTFDLYGSIRVTLCKNIIINLVSVMEALIMHASEKLNITDEVRKSSAQKHTFSTRTAVMIMREKRWLPDDLSKGYDYFYHLRNRVHLYKVKKNEIRENVFTPVLIENCRLLLNRMIFALAGAVKDQKALAEKEAILSILNEKKSE